MQVVFPITESALQMVHRCESHREGEWIIYTCQDCPNYERRVQPSTGLVQVKGATNYAIDHVHNWPR
ncbi:MAG: hypothetical protein DA408_16275 [Bacteroidetes bacterium]|nr:MAG: hypothetical protein C7N36_01565 [Bacteroidota bacterium]PTM10277.1 MAG: hypothetical protein DA408_16275 [Bacteroidota bacterium]